MDTNNDTTSKLFQYGMLWRVFYGFLRIILGFILLKFIDVPFLDIFYSIMSPELAEDPSDLIFNTINTFLQIHPFSVTYFLAGYVFFWGIIDVFLSINLLRHKLWAFPISLYLIGFFIISMIYRFFHTYSLTLLFIIFIDIVIFWLIHREYKKLKSENLEKTPI